MAKVSRVTPGKKPAAGNGKPKASAPKRSPAKAGVAKAGAVPGLPTAKKVPDLDLLKYKLLLYGREKIGKTTFLASFPDALFLTTEPGTKGLSIFEYNADSGGCKNWKLVRAAVDLLEKTDRFKTVVIDTVDRAYDLCMDYVCDDLKIPYPGEDASGKNDYGKSWHHVRQEFLSVIHRIAQTGRGICFTSHAKEQEIAGRSGDKYTRIFPSMSGQARKVIEAAVDLFFYVEYMRAPDGSTSRVIITEGDEIIWAGAREIGVTLPRFIPLTKKGGFEILQAGFKGEAVGLDPKTLQPARNASKAVAEFYKKARAATAPAARKGGGGGKRKVRRETA